MPGCESNVSRCRNSLHQQTHKHHRSAERLRLVLLEARVTPLESKPWSNLNDAIGSQSIISWSRNGYGEHQLTKARNHPGASAIMSARSHSFSLVEMTKYTVFYEQISWTGSCSGKNLSALTANVYARASIILKGRAIGASFM